MEIESVQVIPMSKESKWEDVPRKFEVSFITTDYVTWLSSYADSLNAQDQTMLDKECIAFAKRQSAYMMAPTAMFDNTMYAAKSRVSDTLEGVVIDGPLYRVTVEEVEDKTAEKTEFKKYIDPETFEVKEGFWYPMKKRYRLRYGTKM
jgi:chlorite dismutase